MKLNLVKATLTAAIISTIASAQAQTSEAVVSIIDYPHCSQEQSNQKQKHEPAMRQFTDLLKEELNTQTNKPSNQELEDLIKKSLSIYMCRFQTIE
jgi:serine protease inhibitor ecotin